MNVLLVLSEGDVSAATEVMEAVLGDAVPQGAVLFPIRVGAMGQRLAFWVLTALLTLSQSEYTFSSSEGGKPRESPPASQGASSRVADSPPTASPAPIPVAGIASEAQGAVLRLRRIEREVDAAVKVSDLEERDLAAITRSLKRIRIELETSDSHQNEELINIRQRLAGTKTRLMQLQSELSPRSRLLEERGGELAVMESAWKATSRSLSGKEVPGSSRALIRSTQRRIDQISSLLRRSRPVLLTAQNRASEQQIAVDLMLEEVDGVIDAARSRLFDFESEPLWRAVRSNQLRVELADSIRKSYSGRIVPLIDYMKENKRQLWMHLFVSLLLIWLLTVASRGIRTWVQPTGFDNAPERVLFHPVAAGLVVSLLLAFGFYPYAPLAVYRLSLLLLVFPLALVVLPGIPREERLAFYVLTAVYLLWRLNWLFPLGDFFFRIFILVVACLGIFGVFWAARIDQKAALVGMRPLRRARLQLLRLAALILLASVIANVFGGVRLAALLAGACVTSAYTAIAILAGVLALESFVLPLFHSPVAQMSIALREQSTELRASRFPSDSFCGTHWVAVVDPGAV